MGRVVSHGNSPGFRACQSQVQALSDWLQEHELTSASVREGKNTAEEVSITIPKVISSRMVGWV